MNGLNPTWPRYSPTLSPVGWIHVDRPLAVFDGHVVLVQLAVGRGPVAVKHGVAPVQLDGL